MEPAPEVRLVVDSRCALGESPVWDAARGAVVWTDITGRRLHQFEPASGRHETWDLPEGAGALALCRSGRLLLALRARLAFFDRADGSLAPFVDLPIDPSRERLNDGKVGPDGAFWVGGMDDRPGDKAPVSALFRVSPDGRVERRVEGVAISNGLAWSPDGAFLFHSDSAAPWIDRHGFDPATGATRDRARVAAPDAAAEGAPDGAATDAEGGYWSCGFGAGALHRRGADGPLLSRVALPAPQPTMPCFGGPGLRTLYVASAREGLADDALRAHPLSGGLFALEPGVAGAPVPAFDDA